MGPKLFHKPPKRTNQQYLDGLGAHPLHLAAEIRAQTDAAEVDRRVLRIASAALERMAANEEMMQNQIAAAARAYDALSEQKPSDTEIKAVKHMRELFALMGAGMKQRKLYYDTETFSKVNLPKTGADRYARNCEVLVATFAIDDDEVQCWDRTSDPEMPAYLKAAFEDPDILIVAHNSQFDRWVTKHALGFDIPYHRWRDTMIKAYTLGLPGALGQLGAALQLDDDMQKIADGKKLIRKFCIPNPKNYKVDRYTKETHPEDWERFLEYAIMDTASMRHIDKLLPEWVMDRELDNWHLDQEINDRGLPIDANLAMAAIELCQGEEDRMNAEVVELSGGELSSTGMRDKVLSWIRRKGVPVQGYTKAEVSDMLEWSHLPPECRRVLEIRQELGRTSTAKYEKLLMMAVNHRMRGLFQFYGAAASGRWAGRGFQPQNLPRPNIRDTDVGAQSILDGTTDFLYDKPMDVAASCIRSAIMASPGNVLVVSDYSNIEGRLIAWLAGEAWKIKAFEDFDAGEGPDIYRLSYAQAFNTSIEDADRQIGKVMELACGYQGWTGAFQQMATGYGLVVSDDRAAEIAGKWRKAHPKVVGWWSALEEAAKMAVTCKKNLAYRAGSASFAKRGRWLLCRLPSGRFNCYYHMELVRDGKKQGLRYEGIDQYTRRWSHQSTYGGKLANNVTQGTARDIMAYGINNAHAEGWYALGTVHDELIAEEPEGARTDADLSRVISKLPAWGEGLPLVAAGYTAKRYRKD